MVRMNSRHLYIAIMLALVLLFASACSTKKAADTPTPAPATDSAAPATESAAPATAAVEDQTPVTIQFSNWAGSKTYDAVNAAFTKKYPWITVKWVFADKGVVPKVEESIAAGNPIDVFFNNTYSDVIAKNLNEDLTPYIEKDPEFKAYNFLPGVNEQYKDSNGKQQAITRGTEAFLVYYNKDLMEEYGLTKPAYDWSWEDLRQMAIKATDPSKKRYGFGQVGITTIFGWPMLPYANGHSPLPFMVSADYKTSVADQPDVLKDLQWFRDLIDKDKVLLDTKAAAAAGVKEDLWATGAALFTIHVSPLMETWDSTLKFKWDVMPYPKGTANQAGLMWEQPLFMAKASKHKDAVWKFIKFFTTSKEAQSIFLEKATLLPNTPDTSMKDLLTSLPFYKKYDVDALLYAVAHGKADPTNSMVGGDIINNAWNAFNTDTSTKGTTPYDWFTKNNAKTNSDLAARIAASK